MQAKPVNKIVEWIGKLSLAVLVVGGGWQLLKSGWAFGESRFNSYRCPDKLGAYLRRVAEVLNPTVESCPDDAANKGYCFVKSLSGGSYQALSIPVNCVTDKVIDDRRFLDETAAGKNSKVAEPLVSAILDAIVTEERAAAKR